MESGSAICTLLIAIINYYRQQKIYVMRGDAINFKLKTFIKQCSGLIGWSFEIPHSAYSGRYATFPL